MWIKLLDFYNVFEICKLFSYYGNQVCFGVVFPLVGIYVVFVCLFVCLFGFVLFNDALIM